MALSFDARWGLAAQGNFKRYGHALEVGLARGVTAGAKEGRNTLKDRLRADVISAGLGQRTANTWRGAVYPSSGTSMEATALVYSKAAHIVTAFKDGVTIRSKDGFWLAIPTDEVPDSWRRGNRSFGRVTPGLIEKRMGIRLRLVPASTKTGRKIGLLVADKVRRRKGKRGGFAPASARALKKGDHENVVMFILVPEVKLKKRLHVDAIVAEMERDYREILQRNIDAAIERIDMEIAA